MCERPVNHAGIEAFAQSAGGGLIVTASASTVIHRKLIVALAAKHKLPAVYIHRAFVTDGGLFLGEMINKNLGLRARVQQNRRATRTYS
jgi:hypothetical protein